MTRFRNIGFFLSVGLGVAGFLLLSGVGVTGALENYTLKAADIEKQALKFLTERVPWDLDTTDVTLEYAGKEVVLPAGKIEMNFSLPGRTVRIGRFPLQAKITVNKVFQKRLRLLAQVTRSIPLVKTRRPVNRGDILTAEDVRVEISKSNRNFKHAITRLEDVVGFEAVRNLGSGRVITVNSLRKPPLVEKGDRVTLVAQKGPIKITAPGVVREKGFKNSLIQVLNIQTQKMVFGQVVDSQTVKVNF